MISHLSLGTCWGHHTIHFFIDSPGSISLSSKSSLCACSMHALPRRHHHRHHYFSIPRLLPSLLNYQIDYQLDIKLAIMPTLILYLVNFHTLQYPQHYQHSVNCAPTSLGQYVVQPHQSKTWQGIWHHKSLANVIPCSHGSTSWVSWRVGDAAYHRKARI